MKSLLGFIMTLSVAAAAELNFQCSSSNCILSNYTAIEKTADYTMNFSLTNEEEDGILAVKFQSCELYTIPNTIFNNLLSVLCVMATSPGFSAITEDSFQGAHSLQFLYLQQNRIEKLEPRSFVHAPYLNEINLAENLIEVVSIDAFEGLEHLESLSLSKNKISFFGQGTFDHMKGLMNLDISGNTIEFVDAELFNGNENLNGINIADNQIISITNQFMRLLPQLKVLNMMNNPCTQNTMLESIPLIKIVDSKNVNSEDESALEKCYKYFILATDPESTDPSEINDLLSQADIVMDNIEQNIISELNEELHDKDIIIENLEKRDIKAAFLIVILFGCFFFCFAFKCTKDTVNYTYEHQKKKLTSKVDVEVAMKPEQIKSCYVVELDRY